MRAVSAWATRQAGVDGLGVCGLAAGGNAVVSKVESAAQARIHPSRASSVESASAISAIPRHESDTAGVRGVQAHHPARWHSMVT